jgi:FMN phosphatase YigB (HAD superfamily)
MSNDLSKIRVIAFDLFGTVFDPASADERDRNVYTENLRAWRDSRIYFKTECVFSFAHLKPFDDSIQGLNLLRQAGYKLVAASNIPSGYARESSVYAGFVWDKILALENYRIYKPDLAAYAAICDETKCRPEEVLMVTGNHGKYGIGDDVAPLLIGMQTMKIRRDSPVKDIISLADLMIGVKEGSK